MFFPRLDGFVLHPHFAENVTFEKKKKNNNFLQQLHNYAPRGRRFIFQMRELSSCASHIVSFAASQRRDVPPPHPPGPAGETPGAPADAVRAVPEAAPRLRQVQRELRRHGPHTARGEDTGALGSAARMFHF